MVFGLLDLWIIGVQKFGTEGHERLEGVVVSTEPRRELESREPEI